MAGGRRLCRSAKSGRDVGPSPLALVGAILEPIREGLDRRRALGATRVRVVMAPPPLAPGDPLCRASSEELRFADCGRCVQDIIIVPLKAGRGVLHHSMPHGDRFAFGRLLLTS